MEVRTILAGAAVCLLSVPAGGCGSDSSPGSGPSVSATTGILAEITREVAGPDVEVEQVIPNGASPHDFQLSAQDRQKLDEADLVVDNGADLEAGIPLEEVGGVHWTLADEAPDPIPFGDGGTDPHIWMDPTRVATALPALAAALAEVDPAHADQFDHRAEKFADRLRALDRELVDELAEIPDADRALITSHDSLGYFADRYGFVIVATAFPASGPESEASADDLQGLADAIDSEGVPAVFAGEEDDPEALQTVADEAGVTVVDDLYIESPGEAETYEAMLEHDAGAIAAALSP